MEEVDPRYTIDQGAQQLLLVMADDFVTRLVNYAAMMAKHRNAEAIDVADIQICL
ncbi:unnamed protein product, partial [Heterosigma akashiwo]